jgi:probable phosphoglycerate mutase
MLARTMLLYCIRHGESIYNAEGRIQGRLDVPLSDLGRRQSEAAAGVLRGKPVDALYASTLRRAMETAEIVSKALGVTIRPVPRLMEIDVGVFQGQMQSELARRFPEALAQWTSGDPEYAIPGGESRRQLAERGREAFEAVRRAGHREAVIVAHGGIIVATIKLLRGIPLADPPLSLENGSITTTPLEWRRPLGRGCPEPNRAPPYRRSCRWRRLDGLGSPTGPGAKTGSISRSRRDSGNTSLPEFWMSSKTPQDSAIDKLLRERIAGSGQVFR